MIKLPRLIGTGDRAQRRYDRALAAGKPRVAEGPISGLRRAFREDDIFGGKQIITILGTQLGSLAMEAGMLAGSPWQVMVGLPLVSLGIAEAGVLGSEWNDYAKRGASADPTLRKLQRQLTKAEKHQRRFPGPESDEAVQVLRSAISSRWDVVSARYDEAVALDGQRRLGKVNDARAILAADGSEESREFSRAVTELAKARARFDGPLPQPAADGLAELAGLLEAVISCDGIELANRAQVLTPVNEYLSAPVTVTELLADFQKISRNVRMGAPKDELVTAEACLIGAIDDANGLMRSLLQDANQHELVALEQKGSELRKARALDPD